MGIAVLVAFGAFAFLLARSSGVQSMAERALALDSVDQAIAHADVAYALAGDSLILAVDVERSSSDTEALAQAVEASRQRLGELQLAVAGLDSGEQAAVGRYTGATFAMLDTLMAGDLAGAKAAATGAVAEAFSVATQALADQRQIQLDAVETAKEWAGVAATAAAVAVGLVIPLALLAGYRAMARRQLRRTEEEARRAADEDALRTKDQFLAHVSHELRTPLTGISGFAHVLEEGSLYDPVTGLELVNLIINEAGELNRMVDDLLVASRLDAGALAIDIESVDLLSVVDAVVPSFERYGARIEVNARSLDVLVDPARLRHLLRSLLANAVSHGEAPVRIEVSQVDDKVEVAVIDSGDGVDPEMEALLFERFVHKGDEPLLIGSVGLGLAVARDLARRMGGDIRYVPIEGETRFVLELMASPDLDGLRSDDEALTGGGP